MKFSERKAQTDREKERQRERERVIEKAAWKSFVKCLRKKIW